jgi:hypothetical protein
MNSKQKEVLLVGTLLVLLMILFPPWGYFDIDSSGKSSAGYHFILTPPPLKSPQEMFGVSQMHVPNTMRVRIDDVRLIVQLLVTVPITLGLVPLLSNRCTFIKMGIGFLLIGFALFILGFILWLEISSRQKWSNQERSLTTHSTRPPLAWLSSTSVGFGWLV